MQLIFLFNIAIIILTVENNYVFQLFNISEPIAKSYTPINRITNPSHFILPCTLTPTFNYLRPYIKSLYFNPSPCNTPTLAPALINQANPSIQLDYVTHSTLHQESSYYNYFFCCCFFPWIINTISCFTVHLFFLCFNRLQHSIALFLFSLTLLWLFFYITFIPCVHHHFSPLSNVTIHYPS